MTKNLSETRDIIRYQDGKLKQIKDKIVTESPLTIYVNNKEFVTMVCSPYNFDELVVGFLASEGVIYFKKEIKDVTFNLDRGLAYVNLHKKTVRDQKYFSKRFIGSCCGKGRQFYFKNDVRTAKTSMTNTTITAGKCIEFMNKMQEESLVFKSTGGVHNAALCNDQDIVVIRSDIGRHNALDKIYGYCIINNIPVRNKILVFSGRISSEIMTKAAKIGVGIVLSKSAPTNLAIKLAKELNITSVGFIRGTSFNVYSHPERIVVGEK